MGRGLRAVLFDMDGTLTRPTLNFDAIHAAIGIPEPLLENMLALPPGPARDRAFGQLEAFEEEAAAASELNDGAKDVLEFLERRRIPTGLVTRNSRRSVDRTLAKHGLSFPVVMTREDAPVKPRPEGLWIILKRLAVAPADALMVGDYKFDIQAGRSAGTHTALLTHGRHPSYLAEVPPDHLLNCLQDLFPLLHP